MRRWINKLARRLARATEPEPDEIPYVLGRGALNCVCGFVAIEIQRVPKPFGLGNACPQCGRSFIVKVRSNPAWN